MGLRTKIEKEDAFRAQMRMRKPAEYGDDEVPIPVFYVLEILPGHISAREADRGNSHG